VYDGHTETVSLELERKASIDDVTRVLAEFRGMPQEKGLPSAPPQPIVVTDEPDRPQPARDIWTEKGMATVVGRIRACSLLDVKLVLLGHNTVRGAAGAAILNAEAYIELGYFAP
jgi:aspartate-semialdehyde dehydrogenase